MGKQQQTRSETGRALAASPQQWRHCGRQTLWRLDLTPRKNGRDTMDAEQPQPSAEERWEEAALLKLQAEFRHFVPECRACRRELDAHWQFGAHCGIRLATHCPGCGNPLPPPGAHACPRCGLALPPVSPSNLDTLRR
jgi:hypothetical protein